jgi:hypothetical protein
MVLYGTPEHLILLISMKTNAEVTLSWVFGKHGLVDVGNSKRWLN